MNAFLLLTFVVLPPEKSHRHYLSICLCVAVIMLQVSLNLIGLPIAFEISITRAACWTMCLE